MSEIELLEKELKMTDRGCAKVLTKSGNLVFISQNQGFVWNEETKLWDKLYF